MGEIFIIALKGVGETEEIYNSVRIFINFPIYLVLRTPSSLISFV